METFQVLQSKVSIEHIEKVDSFLWSVHHVVYERDIAQRKDFYTAKISKVHHICKVAIPNKTDDSCLMCTLRSKCRVLAFGCKKPCSLHARCVVYITSRFLEFYLDSFTCSKLDYGSLFIHMQNEVQNQLYMLGLWRSNQGETHQGVNP